MNTDVVEILPTCVPIREDDVASCARFASSFTTRLHLDVDDGLFAPALTWPFLRPGEYAPLSLHAAAPLFVQAHLMTARPREIGLEFVRAGAESVIAHLEAFEGAESAREALDAWRAAGAKEAGLALLLRTPLKAIEPALSACDFVHFMSIASIGTQGIPYDASAPARIADFHADHPDMPLSVDGGVSSENIADLARAGARRFGVGSAISRAADPERAYHALKSIAESAVQ